MNVSKLLTSTAAAVAVVGAIGFAYAQTSPYNSSGMTTNPQSQNQSTTPGQSSPADSSMQNQKQTPVSKNENAVGGKPEGSTSGVGSTGGMNRNPTSTTGMSGTGASGAAGNTSNNPAPMSSERVARADRN